MLRIIPRSSLRRWRSYSSNLSTHQCRAFSSRGPAEDDEEVGDRKLTENLSSANPIEVEQFLRRQEALQRQYQESQKGGENAEMPPDLQEFIKSAPVIVEDYSEAQPVTPRLPRYLREEEEQRGKRPDFNDGRIQERMPLVEKIQGFDTVRTTNFDRTEEQIPKRVFQGGGPIHMFDLLRRRDNGEDPEEIVEDVYSNYGKSHSLPDEEYQQHHKQLLHNTLKYLKIPSTCH